MSTAQKPSRPYARPAYPTLQPTPASSAHTSTYQSYSSTSSLSSPSPASSAPLPSPSSTQSPPHGFFGSLNQQPQSQQAQQQGQGTQHPSTYDYRPNREGAGRTAAETNNYLDQYALLAEAAKRAQMAVLMRDVEGMEL